MGTVKPRTPHRPRATTSTTTMKVAILLCLVGVALCAPQQLLVQEEVIDTPDPYEFSLAVADDELGNHKDRFESQDEFGRVQGRYSWIDANGVRHITTYSSDPDNGYQANTVLEPTDVRVVIPVPQPQV